MANKRLFYENFLTKNALVIPKFRSQNPATAHYRLASKLSLKYIDRVEANFDPFYPNTSSIRDAYFMLSGGPQIKTNEACTFKTNILSDRSEPSLRLTFANGKKLTYLTGILSTPDIIKHLVQYLEDYEQKVDQA